MFSRLNIQALSDPRNIWPISISILMHAIFLAVVTMPRAPKLPEFLTIEMSSFPEFSAPAAGGGSPAPAARAAAPAKAEAAAPQAVKAPEMAEPVKQVKVAPPVAQTAAVSTTSSRMAASSAGGGVGAGSAKGVAGGTGGKGVSGTGTGSGPASGPIEGSFGTANGPAFTYKATPSYPRIARKLHKEGTVVLRVTLDEKGLLKDVKVIQKAGFGFDEAAVNAVKESKFRPAKQRGIPVACRALWKVKFALAD